MLLCYLVSYSLLFILYQCLPQQTVFDYGYIIAGGGTPLPAAEFAYPTSDIILHTSNAASVSDPHLSGTHPSFAPLPDTQKQRKQKTTRKQENRKFKNINPSGFPRTAFA
jgi:hypothetical protein